MPTNNVTRFLDAKKVPYQALQLTSEKRSALETAEFLGVEPGSIYKTIVVVRSTGKPILAVVPGPNRVDLKLLAAVVGEKKLSLPSEREAEQLTGLQAGGISPLALINKGFQIILDASAQSRSEIHVSGGQREVNIRLKVKDLVELTRARIAEISHAVEEKS